MAGQRKPDIDKVSDLIRDAGGQIVGRTRLQKIGYFLEITGLGDGFTFEYRHYGPYSEALTMAVKSADMVGFIQEEERIANWGGTYSVYTSLRGGDVVAPPARAEMIQEAMRADPIELELAATAVFLAFEGIVDAWAETARRKPIKVAGHLDGAKELYRRMLAINTPKRLPQIV